MPEWRNWTGDQVCDPVSVARPRSRDELADLIREAAAGEQTVKVRGSGHSFTGAALTDGVMIDLGAMNRVLDADTASGLVRVQGGISINELSLELDRLGLAMANLGDIDKQSITGAISTATHGTGAKLQNISAQVRAVELVTGSGEVVELTADSDPDGLLAARVSIGALGAVSSVTLQAVPAFALHRIDEPRPLDEVLARIDELAAQNDHFEFFVFPYTDKALTIRRNRTSEKLRPRSELSVLINERFLQNTVGEWLLQLTRRRHALIPRLTKLSAVLLSEGDYIDQSFRIFSSERGIRFTEMEYAIPRANGPEAVRRVLDWISSERYPVAFPIECRLVAPDDALLSPAHARETWYLAVHQYRGMEWRPYFDAVEAIMGEYGGRPHWGKRHSLDHRVLAERYPRFRDFLTVRERFDPGRVFANEYTRRRLGE
jgi:FAD-linked oxidoreductase